VRTTGDAEFVECWGDNSYAPTLLGRANTSSATYTDVENLVRLTLGVPASTRRVHDRYLYLIRQRQRALLGKRKGISVRRRTTAVAFNIRKDCSAYLSYGISSNVNGYCAIVQNGRVVCWGVLGQAGSDTSSVAAEVTDASGNRLPVRHMCGGISRLCRPRRRPTHVLGDNQCGQSETVKIHGRTSEDTKRKAVQVAMRSPYQ